jgi:hypothetical protein
MDVVYAVSGEKSADKLIKRFQKKYCADDGHSVKVIIQAALRCQHFWSTEENFFSEDELLQIKSAMQLHSAQLESFGYYCTEEGLVILKKKMNC